LTSVSLECPDISMLLKVRDSLGLPDALQVMGYLQLIEAMVQMNR